MAACSAPPSAFNVHRTSKTHANTHSSGPLGAGLARRAFERTRALRPRQRWVPWVLVNGVPLFDDFANVATFVCAAYAGEK